MNRRSFLETLAKAAAGFTILPAATTYQRVWRANESQVLVPFWYQTRRASMYYSDEYLEAFNCIMIPPPKTILKTVTHIVEVPVPPWIENFSGPIKS